MCTSEANTVMCLISEHIDAKTASIAGILSLLTPLRRYPSLSLPLFLYVPPVEAKDISSRSVLSIRLSPLCSLLTTTHSMGHCILRQVSNCPEHLGDQDHSINSVLSGETFIPADAESKYGRCIYTQFRPDACEPYYDSVGLLYSQNIRV